jgi:hypothetical protein
VTLWNDAASAKFSVFSRWQRASCSLLLRPCRRSRDVRAPNFDAVTLSTQHRAGSGRKRRLMSAPRVAPRFRARRAIARVQQAAPCAALLDAAL